MSKIKYTYSIRERFILRFSSWWCIICEFSNKKQFLYLFWIFIAYIYSPSLNFHSATNFCSVEETMVQKEWKKNKQSSIECKCMGKLSRKNDDIGVVFFKFKVFFLANNNVCQFEKDNRQRQTLVDTQYEKADIYTKTWTNRQMVSPPH